MSVKQQISVQYCRLEAVISRESSWTCLYFTALPSYSFNPLKLSVITRLHFIFFGAIQA